MDTTNKLAEEQERARFEAWAITDRRPITRWPNGAYEFAMTERCWIGWLAAKSDATQATQAVSEPVATQPAEAARLSESRILQIANDWAKSPGWCDFERNDFIACVRAIVYESITHPAPASASEPVIHTGRWRTDEIGANLYCSSFSHDLKLSIDGDFEDREARKDCADELVRILNARFDERASARVAGAGEGLEIAASWVDKRREDFTSEHGSVDPETGAVEFGRGAHAQAKEEYVGELSEIADGLRALARPKKCMRPPAGWGCWREPGHDGPCAAFKSPRFPMTYCSQCGCEQGPGDEGVSSCADHRPLAARPVADGDVLNLIAEYGIAMREAGYGTDGGQMQKNALAQADQKWDAIKAALARQAPAPLSQAVPEGFWLAPMEPDDLMGRAAEESMEVGGWTTARRGNQYRAMRDSWLSRHPQPQAVTEDARDGERLDWLERAGPFDVSVVVDAPHDGEYCLNVDYSACSYGKTLRDAIDAARAATNNQPKGNTP